MAGYHIFYSLPSNICQIQATLLGQHPPPNRFTDRAAKNALAKGLAEPIAPVLGRFRTVLHRFRTVSHHFRAVSDRSESFSDRFERRTLRKVRENLRKLRENSAKIRESLVLWILRSNNDSKDSKDLTATPSARTKEYWAPKP